MDILQFLFQRHMYDWDIFVAAVHAFFGGGDPYAVGFGVTMRFFNPVWTIIPLTPLVFLPEAWQPIVLAVLPIIVVTLIARRLRYRSVSLFMLLAAPSLWWMIGYGNIDWLVWAGVLMPLPLGLLFLAMKPQATSIAMAVLLLRSRRPILAVVPLAVCVAWWVLFYRINLPDAAESFCNIAWFPTSLIVGLPLAGLAVWKRNLKLAMAAGAFCSPYMSFSGLLALSLASPILGAVYSVYVFLSTQP